MLAQFRTIAESFVAKGILILIVLSFAAWGIGDIFSGGRDPAVIEVGNARVTASQYEEAVQQEMARAKQMYGQDLLELFRGAVQSQVMERIIQRQLLLREIEALGLTVSDAQVADVIRQNPAFVGQDGQFSREAYELQLRSSGLDEKSFVRDLRQDIAIRQLLGAFSVAGTFPSPLLEVMHRSQNERYTVDVVKLAPGLVKDMQTPTDADLVQYFQENKAAFKAPELRTVSFVQIGTAAVGAGSVVTDEQLRQEYEHRKEEYTVAETRDILQLVAATQEKAQEAETALKGGQDFTATAMKFGVQEKATIAQKGVTREALLLPEAAAQVFAAKAGETTGIIRSDLGWHIYRVQAVHEGGQRRFDEVKPQLAKELAQQQSEEALYALVGKLEDAAAARTPLEDVAAAHGLKLQKTQPLTADGKGQDGQPVTGLPAFPAFLKQVFATGQGETSGVIETGPNDYLLFRVDDVVKERERALDEVRGLVSTAWGQQAKAAKLQQLANDVAAKAKEKGLAAALAEAKVTATVTPHTYTRAEAKAVTETVPMPVVMEALTLPVKGTTTPHEDAEGAYVLAAVSAIAPAQALQDAAAQKAFAEQMGSVHNGELLQQYLAYLRLTTPVKVSDALIKAPTEAVNVGQ